MSTIRSKLKYYLASFIAYFIFLYILLWLIDRSNYGKGIADALHSSAFNSKMYRTIGDSARNNFVNELTVKNKLVKLFHKDQYISSQSDVTNSKREQSTHLKTGGLSSQEIMDDIQVNFDGKTSDYESGDNNDSVAPLYTDAFYHYLLQKRCLLGCEGLLYPDGYSFNLLFTSLRLPVGVYEDFIVHLCNNHSLFSCIYRVKGSPISRNACRIVYIVQNCIAFFIFSFTNMIFDYVGLDSNISVLSDLLITSPLSLFFGSVALGLYTCPIVNSIEFEKSVFTSCKGYIVALGRFMILPLVALMFGLLLLSALCTRRSNIIIIILSFIWQAQLQAFILEFIYAILLFKSSYYYQLKVAGIPLIEIGSLFAERVSKSIQQEYYMYYTRYFQGLFVRDYITSIRVAKIKEVSIENHRLRQDVHEPNTISVLSPNINMDVDGVEVFENPLLAAKKAPRLSKIGFDTVSAPLGVTRTLDDNDPEHDFNDTVKFKKNIFQTVKLDPAFGTSYPLKMMGHHTTQRKSDIQWADMDGPNIQTEGFGCDVEVGDASEEELDTFDDTVTFPDIISKSVNQDARKRGTAFVGYDTAYQKPKVTNSNPIKNKVTAKLKDTKHINTVTINEDEENDDALYEEFQAFRNDLNRHSEVGLSSEGDEISFEDWKIKRKDLRAKDVNYVSAFRFFERREQEHGEKAPKLTSSQQRAMGLHTKFGRRASALRQDDSTKAMKPEQSDSGNNARSI